MNQLYIRKRSLPEWFALLLVCLPFGYSFLTELMGLPNIIKFVSDFLICVSIAIVLSKSNHKGQLYLSRSNLAFVVVVSLFFLYTLIGYLLNYQTFLYYLWGVRNNFRFYMTFLILICFMKEEDASKCLDIIDVLFWVHIVVTLIQYFVFSHEQDFLGGIFGVQKGCNGYTIAFICIVVAKSVLSYMNGKEKPALCMTKCAAALLVSALAELKIFFLFFLLLLTISAIITRFSAKKLFLILVSFFLMSIAYTILVTLFKNFRGFLSIENILNELAKENYASSEDIGRFTSIPIISERFLTTLPDRLLGMGLGNCDTSTISIFNTEFYDRYVDLHYSIFSVAFIFIETGFVGLLLFSTFFVVCLVKSVIALRREEGNLLFNQMGIIMSILCLVLMFYNSSLRTEAGYMIYFVLALPFIGLANKSKTN